MLLSLTVGSQALRRIVDKCQFPRRFLVTGMARLVLHSGAAGNLPGRQGVSSLHPSLLHLDHGRGTQACARVRREGAIVPTVR